MEGGVLNHPNSEKWKVYIFRNSEKGQQKNPPLLCGMGDIDLLILLCKVCVKQI